MRRTCFSLLVAIAGMAATMGQAWAQTTADQAAAKQLGQTISTAAKENRTACNKSVAAVAEKFGISSLSGKLAKDQLASVAAKGSGWKQITPQEAQELANQGKFVIAGHGNHVAVPVPGEVDSRYHHPKLAGGSLNSATPDVPGAAYSTDGQTVNYVFRKSAVPEIKYYAPENGQAIEVPAAVQPEASPVSFQPGAGKTFSYDDYAVKQPAIPHPGGVLMKMDSGTSTRRTGATPAALLNRLRPGN